MPPKVAAPSDFDAQTRPLTTERRDYPSVNLRQTQPYRFGEPLTDDGNAYKHVYESFGGLVKFPARGGHRPDSSDP